MATDRHPQAGTPPLSPPPSIQEHGDCKCCIKYIYLCMHAYAYMHIYTCSHLSNRTNIKTITYPHMCTNMNSPTHIHTLTHTHTHLFFTCQRRFDFHLVDAKRCVGAHFVQRHVNAKLNFNGALQCGFAFCNASRQCKVALQCAPLTAPNPMQTTMTNA